MEKLNMNKERFDLYLLSEYQSDNDNKKIRQSFDTLDEAVAEAKIKCKEGYDFVYIKNKNNGKTEFVLDNYEYENSGW